MPYLDSQTKASLDAGAVPESPGDLTYLFTKALLGDPREATLHEALQAAVDRYLGRLVAEGRPGPKYADYCEVIGALTCAALEFERRNGGIGELSDAHWRVVEDFMDFTNDYYTGVVGAYEDTKIAENGDVYE